MKTILPFILVVTSIVCTPSLSGQSRPRQAGFSISDRQVIEGDVAAQARQALDNLGAVLAAAGASFANVVKTTVFLADMADFSTVNAIYGERFPSDPPARSTVAAAGLPRNARVEVEAVAII